MHYVRFQNYKIFLEIIKIVKINSHHLFKSWGPLISVSMSLITMI